MFIGPKGACDLAHPLRWQMLDLLGAEGTVTVTRCALVLGESTASCSYHLGILAKYGYITPAEGEGRESRGA
ncbi:MAG: winged helix-turn-helix domain-containing protein [Actinomycetota bacterium]